MEQHDFELILINIAGEDRPGLTSVLTEILGRHDATILDIGQADIHHTLSLGILFKTTSERSGIIMKELLFKANEMNVSIRFSPVTVEAYDNWVARQGKHRWIITILGRRTTAKQIAAVSRVVAHQGLNIDAIQRLTGRMPLQEGEKAYEQGLDLVEISPTANPPVCRIVDYQKFMYELKKKQKEQKSKSTKIVIKEIRLGPQTDDHDFDFKLNHAIRFLKEGSKVKVDVFFKGRTIVYKEQGEAILLKFAEALLEYGKPEKMPQLEGKRMMMIIAPKK